MRLLIYLLLGILFTSTTSVLNFQKIIWVYWQTGIASAPLVTRISYQKLVIAAQKANWIVNLVSAQNAKNFIPDYQRFEDVVKRGYRNTVQQKSDILRITLVQANGGVWIDFACVLFEDLAWLSDEKSFEKLIINRIGTNKQDPDMLMLGQGYHQSPLSYYNSDGVLQNDQYFGMAIHFIAAKKKSPIMTAWKQKMYTITTLSYQQFVPQIRTKRLYFHNIDRDTMYYSGNMALESVLQEKQMEFDDNLNLTSKRVNVYEHYKIWMVHGEVGPILMTRKHLMNGRDLFMDTMEEIEKRAGRVRFYLKMAKFLRQEVEEKQKPSEEYFSTNNITIQQILQRGPTFKQCQLFFIVKGSILHNFYQDSKYLNQIKIPFISVQQRQQLKSHCQYKAPSIYLSSHSYRSEGQMTRPQRELMEGEVNGVFGWLEYVWVTNSLVFLAWFEWFRTFVYLVVGYGVGKYLYFRFDAMKISGVAGDEYGSVDDVASRKNDNCLETKTKFRFEKPHLKEIIIVTLLIFISSAILQFYEEFQDMGKYPQYQCTLLAIFSVFLLRGFTKKLTKPLFSTTTFFNMQKIAKDTRYITYLPLAFCVFLHFDIIYSLAFYNTVVIGGGGLMLYGLLQEMQERNITTKYFSYGKKVLKWSRWVVMAIFIGFYFWSNLRYMRSGQRYIKQSISEVSLWIFWSIFLFNVTFITIFLYKKVRNCHQDTKKHELYHLMFSTVSISLITLQSHLNFSKILQSPSSYYVMGNFQVILILYTLQNISLRQRLPHPLTSCSKKLFIMTNILPILYIIFGMSFMKLTDMLPQRWIWFMIIPLYVVMVIAKDEWISKREFSKVDAQGTEMFHGVELRPDTSFKE